MNLRWTICCGTHRLVRADLSVPGQVNSTHGGESNSDQKRIKLAWAHISEKNLMNDLEFSCDTARSTTPYLSVGWQSIFPNILYSTMYTTTF